MATYIMLSRLTDEGSKTRSAPDAEIREATHTAREPVEWPTGFGKRRGRRTTPEAARGKECGMVATALGEQGAPAAGAARTTVRARPPLWVEQQAALELAELFVSPVFYGVGVPRGDGTPVLLLPGFLGSDDYLLILRGWLRRIGYQPYPSGLALCAGPLDDLTTRMLHRAEVVATATGQRLTLIGHSLGGLLGCRVALRRPDLVAHVVTLATARGAGARRSAHPLVAAMADLLLWQGAPPREQDMARVLLSSPLPDGVRLTSIYSRGDAVVDWRACRDADPRTALHEVRGTHTGLAWNAAVYRVLGRCLLM
jgi:triacylglycerol lipase